MEIGDQIMKMIDKEKLVPVKVEKSSNLYRDLGFDSLAFICLLIDIEHIYSITFDIWEMEMCLQIDQLILLVENKLKEHDVNYD